jgi:hypothetical protein
MRILITLSRPFDRHPSDHFYGEPFDAELDKFVGGKSAWSFPREDRSQRPQAKLKDRNISIELHEDGPVIDFIAQNLAQLPDYVSAISAIVSAWAATRALRKRDLPPDDFRRKGGTVVETGDLRFESKRNLEPEELIEITEAMARFRERHSGSEDSPDDASREPSLNSQES